MLFSSLLNKNLKKNKVIYYDDQIQFDVEYTNIISNLAKSLNKIVKHRNGKLIRPNDVYLLGNINLNKHQILKDLSTDQLGGDYIGYCDNLPGQCSDMSTTPQCGGDYIGYCDNLPGQCSDMSTTPQCGGDYIGYCDNLPGQCSDMSTTPQCGGDRKSQKGGQGWCDNQPTQCETDYTQLGGQGWCDDEPSQCETDYTQLGGQEWCDGQPSQCETDYSILGGGLKKFKQKYNMINRKKFNSQTDKELFHKFMYIFSLNSNYKITQSASNMVYDMSIDLLKKYVNTNFN